MRIYKLGERHSLRLLFSQHGYSARLPCILVAFHLCKILRIPVRPLPGEAQERVGYNEVDSIFYSTQEDVL
jgi:hypothetical protein